ncbi:MAG TPA: YdeI/OmpD-associated family protein [Kofleriaceae bacterium]|nr:YdeI/OmpD-associated family protein [Kofleriaceae bacterium]
MRRALGKRGLMRAYRARPLYQQNDYLIWIAGAAREETMQRRLDQMLDELEGGNRYMKMKWKPRAARKK